MKFSSPRQLKDWISNAAKDNNQIANTILQNYMMERLLERISISKYKDNFILKGGFLIAAMIGINMRSTLDMDTTVKGLSVSKEKIEVILNEIVSIDLNDGIILKFINAKSIHDVSEYDDFRISIEAQFYTIKVNMKIDITTGDVIIPKEVDFSYKLMFEERHISIKAYNLNTIFAEKIESIISRNIANTRARDYYDVYVLYNTRKNEIDFLSLSNAIKEKTIERNTEIYLEHKDKFLNDIEDSNDLKRIWSAYSEKYAYAQGIQFGEIITILREILES